MLRLLMVCAVGWMSALPVSAADPKPAEKPATAPADTYPIRLHRPSKVGDQFRIEADGVIVRKSALTIDNKEQPAMEERMGIGFDGVVTVQEVAANGVETKLSIRIDRCEARVFGPEGKSKAIPLLPKGSELAAAWNKEKKSTEFTLDGQAIPEEFDELLELAVNTSDPESQSDDEIFGSKEKRSVGDSWSVNAAAAAKEFTRMGIKCREEDIFGTTTLAGQSAEGGVPSLQLKTEFKVRSFASGDKADQKIRLVSGNMSIDTQVTMPVDVSRSATKVAMEMKLVRQLAGKNDEGKEVQADETVQRMWERSIRAVEKKL